MNVIAVIVLASIFAVVVTILLRRMRIISGAAAVQVKVDQDLLARARDVARTRGKALDYIVRSRVVDYRYDYHAYEIEITPDGLDRIHRTMIFCPPKDRDIICKLITLCEHREVDGSITLSDCSFDATMYAPIRDSGAGTLADCGSKESFRGWEFESRPWLVEVTDEEGGQVKVIVVFMPMITDIRKLEMKYTWPEFLPGLRSEERKAAASFRLIKPTRILEIKIHVSGAEQARLTLYPPDKGTPVTEEGRASEIVVRLEDAPRGTYSYDIEIMNPASP